MAQWNSDGYIFIDFKDVNFTYTNQTIEGLYKRAVDVIGTNKFILVINANGRSPLPGTISFTNSTYVIDTVLYVFSISSNDNLFIRRKDIPSEDIIDDNNISIHTCYSSYKIDNTYQKKLTAGDNIAISAENVISATDTTYTAGTGIAISAGNEISCDATASEISYSNTTSGLTADDTQEAIDAVAAKVARIFNITYSSSQPGYVPITNRWGVYFLMGFFQSIGAKALLVMVDNFAVTNVIDISTGETFSSSAVTFTYTSAGLKIEGTSASVSTITAIC